MYLELGLFAEADRLSAEAVRLAPGSDSAWHLRGRIAMARGQFGQAVADFHRGLAIAPDDRGLLRDAAEAYLGLGKPRRALWRTLGKATARRSRRATRPPRPPDGSRRSTRGRSRGEPRQSPDVVRPVSRSKAAIAGTSIASVANP